VERGGDVLEGERVVIDSPEAAEGLSLRRSMIVEKIAPRATGDYTTQDSQAVFTNGDVVFMRNWPFVYGLLSDPESSQLRPEQVGISQLPVAGQGDESFSGLGGWNFMVNAGSEDRLDEIWTFIEFMSAPEQQKTFALESARPRPVSPYYSDMSLVMAEQFNASLKGDKPVEEALGDLQTELQNIVDQA